MNFNQCALCKKEITAIDIEIPESGGFWLDFDFGLTCSWRVCCSCCMSNIEFSLDIFKAVAEKIMANQ